MDYEVQAPLSPFLPGTNIQFAWDSTSLGYLKTCPRLYYYQMICGWQGKDESLHLRFGQEYHSAIEEYEKLRATGVSFNDAVRESIRNTLARIEEWDPDITTKAGRYKNRRSLIQLCVDYFDRYRNDVAETYILADSKPAVELSFRFEIGWGPYQTREVDLPQADGTTIIAEETTSPQPYLLCGHLDRVVDYNHALFVLDHKTTTTTPNEYYFDNYNPNNQMTLYTLAAKVVYNAPVKGVIIEAAQILLEKPNAFQRGISYRTQDQLDEWLEDLHEWLGKAERYATLNYWPMNDTSCDKFGGCRFREICSKSPTVRDKFLQGNFVQAPLEERWNPLKPR